MRTILTCNLILSCILFLGLNARSDEKVHEESQCLDQPVFKCVKISDEKSWEKMIGRFQLEAKKKESQDSSGSLRCAVVMQCIQLTGVPVERDAKEWHNLIVATQKSK
ncbi:MAG: hypothetical protein R3C11_06705 [Planctomycetaceae bacterium]